MNPHIRTLLAGKRIVSRHYSSRSAGGGGSKVLPTVLLVTGGSAAGLGAYYYYDPNAELFKQAKSLIGVDTQPQPKPSTVKTNLVAPSPPPTQKTAPPPLKETKVEKKVPTVIAPPPPTPPPVVAPPPPAPKAPVAASTIAATALPTPPVAAADKPKDVAVAGDSIVPKQVLVTALRAQQEALCEAHEAKLKTVQREYERKLDNAKKVIEADRVVELRGKYEKASAALSAIEKGIEARSDQNTRAKRLRALWAQVNALHARVNHPEYHGSTITPIDKNSLRKAIEVPDKFVNQMLESLPNQPVHSLESLKTRFYSDLEPVAKNVSLIKEGEKFSLLKYACGKVLSWGVVQINRDSPSDKPQSTTQVLDVAKRSLDKGDLLSAAVAVNKLTGLPRQVATDWLADARALLETNQTLFALMTYAASNNVF